MKRSNLNIAIAAALVALLAAAGCKKPGAGDAGNASQPVSPAPGAQAPPATPPPATPAPASTVRSVTALDLGNAIGADNRIANPMTTFGTRDSIHAAVASDGPAGTLTARWTMGDAVVDTQDKTVAAGPQMTEFSISKPGGWPVGHYRLQVSSGGNVLQSRDFEIK